LALFLGSAINSTCGKTRVPAFPDSPMRVKIAAEIRAMLHASERKSADELLQAAFQKYATTAPRLSAWIKENPAEGFTVFDFPLEHRKMIYTTNSLERINWEIRRL